MSGRCAVVSGARWPESRRGRPRRVVVIREDRYADQLQPAGLVGALSAAGHVVTVVGGDVDDVRGPARLRAVMARADVIVARGRSTGVLTALATAARLGVPVIDTAEAVCGVWDKAAMARVLSRAGVPTPATFFAPIETLVERVPARSYPLILKPVHGDNARGLRIVTSRAELSRLRWPEQPALAQSYLPGNGLDVKLYVIGDHVAAVRKPSPITPCASSEVQQIPVDDRLGELARTCGRLFGLTVFGVDCLETRRGPLVIEVNDFPNFTAVPGADALLARHVLATARRPDGWRPR
jgi:ribosomal protein S6--L-glutamate ligase